MSALKLQQFEPREQHVRSASGDRQYTIVPPPGLAIDDSLELAVMAAQDIHSPFLTPSDVEYLPDDGDEVRSV